MGPSNNPPGQRAIDPSELRKLPCKKCGETLRRPIALQECVTHYLDKRIAQPVDVLVWICISCREQITFGGDLVKIEDPLYVKEKIWW